MNKKIIFRADGNEITGLGHLYRIFALIEIYKNNYDCTLIVRKDSTLSVIPSSYNYKIIPGDVSFIQEPNWLVENFPSDFYLLIVDGYQFGSVYQKAIKTLNYQLIYIDDLMNNHMYADVVINHSLIASEKNYDAEPYCKFAFGTKYAILRPRFLAAAKKERVISKIDTAFVCFGGADMFNLSYTASQALLKFKEIKKIHVVLGAAYSHQNIYDLEKLCSHLIIYRNLTEEDLIGVMESCNFAIVPASTILYEICAVKMPTLSGYYVENQKGIYNGCVQNNLVYAGGNFEGYSTEHFEKKIEKIIAEKNYQLYVHAQSKLFDSKIQERFLKLIVQINFRKANSEDLLLVYNWANEKVSRANSYYSDEISIETHTEWFEKKLKDDKCYIYIAEVDGLPAGMVRYEKGEDYTVVGILVGDNYRGRGFAVDFLLGTAKYYFNENSMPILAYIKVENIASITSFERAGYKKFKTEVIHGKPSIVYKMEK